MARYWRDPAGNLYRVTATRTDMCSPFLDQVWTPLLLPLRARRLTRVSALRAVGIAAWRRLARWTGAT